MVWKEKGITKKECDNKSILKISNVYNWVVNKKLLAKSACGANKVFCGQLNVVFYWLLFNFTCVFLVFSVDTLNQKHINIGADR